MSRARGRKKKIKGSNGNNNNTTGCRQFIDRVATSLFARKRLIDAAAALLAVIMRELPPAAGDRRAWQS